MILTESSFKFQKGIPFRHLHIWTIFANIQNSSILMLSTPKNCVFKSPLPLQGGSEESPPPPISFLLPKHWKKSLTPSPSKCPLENVLPNGAAKRQEKTICSIAGIQPYKFPGQESAGFQFSISSIFILSSFPNLLDYLSPAVINTCNYDTSTKFK